MKHELLWRLDTSHPETAIWKADGLGGLKYDILLGGKDRPAEAVIWLHTGQCFIACIEDPTTHTIDELKQYLNAHHDLTCKIRDLTAFMVSKEAESLAAKAADKPSIIVPPNYRP